MTWLMDNQRPLAVTAMTQRIKPAIYPRVDDEATILLEYPKAQGIIQASWNWPFGRKDLEVYGATGYAIATGGDSLRVRLPGAARGDRRRRRRGRPTERDELAYLAAVVRGKIEAVGPVVAREQPDRHRDPRCARESARHGQDYSADAVSLGGLDVAARRTSRNVGQFGPRRVAAAVLAEGEVAVDQRRLHRRELGRAQILLARAAGTPARRRRRPGTCPSRRPSRLRPACEPDADEHRPRRAQGDQLVRVHRQVVRRAAGRRT